MPPGTAHITTVLPPCALAAAHPGPAPTTPGQGRAANAAGLRPGPSAAPSRLELTFPFSHPLFLECLFGSPYDGHVPAATSHGPAEALCLSFDLEFCFRRIFIPAALKHLSDDPNTCHLHVGGHCHCSCSSTPSWFSVRRDFLCRDSSSYLNSLSLARLLRGSRAARGGSQPGGRGMSPGLPTLPTSSLTSSLGLWPVKALPHPDTWQRVCGLC